MVYHRIQKLLFSEYCDFEDMVLIESPFAQTTRDGIGLRQIHLGLTPTKLIFAVDVLPPADDAEVFCPAEIDPEIESFELIAMYPVEAVNVSVYRRKKRQTLKVHFCNNRILYLELGGYEKRRAFWNLWCERVKFLCPEVPASSKSETSVATSTSNSSLYLESKRNVIQNGRRQIWCTFGMGENTGYTSKWVDKYIYLGPEFEDELALNQNYQENNKPHMTGKTSTKKKKNEACSNEKHSRENKLFRINRFGSGILEGCNTGLFLPAEECEVVKQFTSQSTQSLDTYTFYENVSSNLLDLSEAAVKTWELSNFLRKSNRHPRRYGIAPEPYFLYGLGCCNTYEKEYIPTQLKPSLSESKMKENELKLTAPKSVLTASLSCEAFHLDRNLNISSFGCKRLISDKNPLLFWTPEYWRQVKPAYQYYFEFLQHLQQLRNDLGKKSRKKCHKKGNLHYFSRKNCKECKQLENEDTNVQKRIHQELKMDVALTAWDFDSATLAYELVSIDKELLLQIDPIELEVLMWQRSSLNAPNIRAMLVFSSRISCLVTTEILREHSEKARSKLIVKFINIAKRCDRISSYQSCKSILNGLQSPPIYRLHHTWTYIRQHHATKYQLLKQLCYKYSDPRSISYLNHFAITSQNPPYLPYVGDILARFLDNFISYSEESIHSFQDGREIRKCAGICDVIEKEHPTHQRASTIAFSKFISTLESLSEGERPRQQVGLQVRGHQPELEHSQNDGSETRRIVDDVAKFLVSSQRAASMYVFGSNGLARQYLLKARYRAATDNFFHSMKIEPK